MLNQIHFNKMIDNKFKSEMADNIHILDDRDLTEELQNVLNTESKKSYAAANSNFNLDIYQDQNRRIMRNFCAYSLINKELYILLKFKSPQQNFSYSLLTFSIETNNLKSHKILKFYFDFFDKRDGDPKYSKKSLNSTNEINFDVKDVIIEPKYQNQICLFSEEFLAFIPELKHLPNDKPNSIDIKIIHTSLLEKEFRSSSRSDSNIPNHKFKKFKFSEFENYFGVLFYDNTFRFYNINSSVAQSFINFQNQIEIVDFAFGLLTDFGWQNFCIFFLDANGGISYVCPIFPDSFKIRESFLTQMNKFQRNLKILEHSNENLMNENLLFHLEKSIVDYDKIDDEEENNIKSSKNSKFFNSFKNSTINSKKFESNHVISIKLDEYLKNFNTKPNIENLVIIDKRRTVDLLILNQNYSNYKPIYDQLYILNSYPLTFLRISKNNFIDVIYYNQEMVPNRKNFGGENTFSDEKCSFLIETIHFDIINTQNNFSPSLKILNCENFDKNQRTSIFVNILNNLYELNFPYIQKLAFLLKNFNGKEDLNFGEFNCEINEILNFDYESNNNSKIPFGYFGLEKIDGTFLLISLLNGDNMSEKNKKFLVKQVRYIHSQEIKYTHNEKMNFNRFNLNKHLFESNISTDNLNELLEKFIKTNSSKISNSSLTNSLNLIREKEIFIDEQNLKKFSSSFENLEEFIKLQTQEIFKYYDKVISDSSYAIKDKFQILSEVIEKIDYHNNEKLQSQIETERTLIVTQKIEVEKKKKLIEDKINSVESKLNRIAEKDPRIIERYVILKKLFENNLKNLRSFKKTSEEVKSELNNIMEQESKKIEIIQEKLDPTKIKKEFINKQVSYEKNLNDLKREVIVSLRSLKIE